MQADSFLLRLLVCPPISRNTKLGPEAKECIRFANMLRELVLTGRMNAVFCHIPNEGQRSPMAGAKLKAEGLIPGAADYVFTGASISGYIEFKSRKGRPTATQLDFAKWCLKAQSHYAVCRSAEEGIEMLKRWGLIL